MTKTLPPRHLKVSFDRTEGPVWRNYTKEQVRLAFCAFLRKCWLYTYNAASKKDPRNILPSLYTELHLYGEQFPLRLFILNSEDFFPSFVERFVFHNLKSVGTNDRGFTYYFPEHDSKCFQVLCCFMKSN